MPLLYAPFTKVEETPDGLIVEGIATTERVDTENEVVDYESIKAQLPDYAEWGNIRAMHQPIAAGTALLITPNDEEKSVYLRALIVDDDSQKKVRTKTYKGFSIGGKASSKIVKRDDGSTYTRRYTTLLSEISLVDRPANPDARFTLIKREGMMPPDKETEQQQDAAPALDAETIAAIKRLAGKVDPPIEKAASDPTKIVAMIQAARNELELAGDMQGASLMTQAIALVQQAAGEAEEPEASEPPADATMAEGEIAANAKPGNLKKAGRVMNAANLAAMENTVKTLLQMMAAAGSTKAQKAIGAMADDGPSDATMAQAIGAEFTKAVTPIAQAVLSLHSDVEALKRQPAGGGPVLRPALTKQITGQKPADAAEKPQASALVKAQLDDLWRKLNTEPSPGLRNQYRAQYDSLKAQYS